MAQAYETRHRRNGAINLHDDVTALQKDFSKLTGDIGGVIQSEWNGIGARINKSAADMGKQVRARPIAAVGVAAGVGLLAGVLVAGLARRRR
ncbi:MAG: hypothetical protein AB7T59_17880 [Hyphomonadaceae bacterium]